MSSLQNPSRKGKQKEEIIGERQTNQEHYSNNNNNNYSTNITPWNNAGTSIDTTKAHNESPEDKESNKEGELSQETTVTLPVYAMNCQALINDKPVHLILDSGSSRNVVSREFLDEIGKKIQRPSNVVITGIHGEKRAALGEVSLTAQIAGKIIPFEAIVSDATNYSALAGNAWLTQLQAVLDWRRNKFKFIWQQQEYIIPASCQNPPTTSNVASQPDPVQQTSFDYDLDQFEEDYDPVEEPSLVARFDQESIKISSTGLQMNGVDYGWTYIDLLKDKFLKEDSDQHYYKGPNVTCWCGIELDFDEECFECQVDEENWKKIQLLAPEELKIPQNVLVGQEDSKTIEQQAQLQELLQRN